MHDAEWRTVVKRRRREKWAVIEHEEMAARRCPKCGRRTFKQWCPVCGVQTEVEDS
jgi:uncharacterized OB-fold protein